MENRRADPQPISYSSLASGTTELSIHFQKAPTENVVVYVWNEYEFSWELSSKNGITTVDHARKTTGSGKRRKRADSSPDDDRTLNS